MTNKRFLAILAMVFTTMVWGVTFEMVQEALNDAPPFIFGAFRFGIGFFICFFYFLFFDFDKINIPISISEIKGGVMCGIVLCIGYAFQNFGLWDNIYYLKSTPSNSAFITSISVLLVPAFLYLFNIQKIHYRLWGIIIIALLGLFILLDPLYLFNSKSVSSQGVSGGDIITFGCAVSFAIHIILQDIYLKKGADLFRFFMLQVLFVSLFSFVCSFIASEETIIFSYDVILALLVTGVIATSVAFILMLWAQTILSATETGVLLSLEPLFAAIYSVYIGKMLGFNGWLGGLIIIIAVISSSFLSTKHSENH